jgi:hypothetical protein
VIVIVNDEQPRPVCVSACHVTAQLLPFGSLEW